MVGWSSRSVGDERDIGYRRSLSLLMPRKSPKTKISTATATINRNRHMSMITIILKMRITSKTLNICFHSWLSVSCFFVWMIPREMITLGTLSVFVCVRSEAQYGPGALSHRLRTQHKLNDLDAEICVQRQADWLAECFVCGWRFFSVIDGVSLCTYMRSYSRLSTQATQIRALSVGGC